MVIPKFLNILITFLFIKNFFKGDIKTYVHNDHFNVKEFSETPVMLIRQFIITFSEKERIKNKDQSAWQSILQWNLNN